MVPIQNQQSGESFRRTVEGANGELVAPETNKSIFHPARE
jgi:hypothetical protein